MQQTDTAKLGIGAYLATSISATIGVGWLTVSGQWLSIGPMAAVIGLLFGALVLSGVAACYGELAGMMPSSGGEIVYARTVFGRLAAFVVGWVMLSHTILLLSFEAVSLGWVLETLSPALRGPILYRYLGEAITLPQFVASQLSLWGFFFVNKRGLRTSARVLQALTVIKVVVVAAFVLGGLALAEPGRVFVTLQSDSSKNILTGVLGVCAVSPLWLGGYNVIASMCGDRNAGTSVRTLGVLMIAMIGISLAFYIGVIVASAAAAPLDQTIQAHLPSAFAASAIFHSEWAARIILIAGLLGLLGAINAFLLSASRLWRGLVDMGALRSQGTGKDQYDFAPIVLAASLLSLAGKGAIGPILGMGALAQVIIYVLMCLAAIKLRFSEPERARPFQLAGGIPVMLVTLVAVLAMATFLLIKPLFDAGGAVPPEWLLFGAWTMLGGIIGVRLARRNEASASPLN